MSPQNDKTDPIQYTSKDLKKAIKQNDLDRVKKCISSDIDFNKNISFFRTPLEYAVSLKHYDIALYMLECAQNGTIKIEFTSDLSESFLEILLDDPDVENKGSIAQLTLEKAFAQMSKNIVYNRRSALLYTVFKKDRLNTFKYFISHIDNIEHLTYAKSRNGSNLLCVLKEVGRPEFLDAFIINRDLLKRNGGAASQAGTPRPLIEGKETSTVFCVPDPHTLEITQYLSTGKTLSHVFNFATERATTLTENFLVNEDFEKLNATSIEFAAKQLNERDGESGTKWKRHFPDVYGIDKSGVINPLKLSPRSAPKS